MNLPSFQLISCLTRKTFIIRPVSWPRRRNWETLYILISNYTVSQVYCIGFPVIYQQNKQYKGICLPYCTFVLVTQQDNVIFLCVCDRKRCGSTGQSLYQTRKNRHFSVIKQFGWIQDQSLGVCNWYHFSRPHSVFSRKGEWPLQLKLATNPGRAVLVG